MFEGLPEMCYVLQPVTQEAVIVKRGEKGYYQAAGLKGEDAVKELNAQLDVTPAQAEAMLVGSMFGWDVPGANPAMYDESGKPLRKSK